MVLESGSNKSSKVNPNSFFRVDGGFAWLIVLQAFIVSVLVDGSNYSFGVYFTYYIATFNQSSATIAWIGSIASGVCAAGGIISGYLCDKYGNRIVMIVGAVFISFGYFMASLSTEVWQLFFSQGLCCGIGYSLAYNAGVSVVGQWFDKKRGLALGLAMSGSGLGQFIMVNFTSSLLNSKGWRGTLQYTSLIEILGLAFCAVIVRKLYATSTVATKTTKDNNNLTMLKQAKMLFKDRHFFYLYFGYLIAGMSYILSLAIYTVIILCILRILLYHVYYNTLFTIYILLLHSILISYLYICLLIAVFGYCMPFVHLPNYALQHGLSVDQSNLILSMIGIASAGGRISLGFVADRVGKLLMVSVRVYMYVYICNE